MSNGCKYCNGSGWITDSIGHCIACGHCGGYVHGVYEYRSASSPAVKLATFTSVADSGKREDFSTGSVRDTREGKGRYDLLPAEAIARIARHFENGAKKYSQPIPINLCDMESHCSCGKRHAIRSGFITLAECVEVAMSEAFALVTQSLLKGSEKTVGLGLPKTGTARELETSITAVLQSTGPGEKCKPSTADGRVVDFLLNLARDFLLKRMENAQFAKTALDHEAQTSTTTMPPVWREDFFALAVTKVWACWEIRKLVFGEHSNTCSIHQLRPTSTGMAVANDRNWEKGQPLSRYLDSGLRHMFKVLAGEVDEDHAAAAAWNIMAFITTQERVARGALPAELNDLPRGVHDTEKERPAAAGSASGGD